MRTFSLILTGIIVHMLYLDGIIITQHYIIDNCPLDEKADIRGELPCLKYGNETKNRFKFKYFNLAYLIRYKNVITPKWTME